LHLGIHDTNAQAEQIQQRGVEMDTFDVDVEPARRIGVTQTIQGQRTGDRAVHRLDAKLAIHRALRESKCGSSSRLRVQNPENA
jgi:hypothetical protein